MQTVNVDLNLLESLLLEFKAIGRARTLGSVKRKLEAIEPEISELSTVVNDSPKLNKRYKYITVKYFYSDREYTYKCNLDVKHADFVVVPTVRGNTVARVEEIKVKKPEFLCKKVISKVEM